MTRLPERLVLGALALTIAILVLALAWGELAGENSAPWGSIGPAAFVLVLLALLLLAGRDLADMFGGVDPNASAIAARLGQRPEQRLLLRRWLRRSRRYRNIGGVTGVLAGFLIGGLGGIILLGLIGLTVGSLQAEVHLLRADRPGPSDARVVGLERRTLAGYWQPIRQVVLALVGLGAVALIAADRLGWLDFRINQWWSLAAAVAVIAAFAIQWRVATRARPALPAALRESDDLVRSLAITHGIANPVLSLALAFIGQAVASGAPLLSAAAWLAALALFWRFRRLGLDWLLDQPPLSPTVAAG